jgi:hypothetical protein
MIATERSMQVKGFLLGVVCGTAFTLAVTQWSGQEPPESAAGSAKENGVTAPIKKPDESDASAWSSAPRPPQIPSPEFESGSATPAESSSTATAAAPQTSVDPDAVSSVPAPGASLPGSTTPPALIAPLFTELFSERAGGLAEQPVAQIHRKLSTETEDDAWSPYMETNIRNFLQQRPGFDRIEIFVLDCRTTICEIQAAGFQTDIRSEIPAVPHPDQVFQSAMSDLQKQPWGVELRHAGTLVTTRDDRVLFVAQFTLNR